MSRKAQELATQIKQLTDELVTLAKGTNTSSKPISSQKRAPMPKGASGALTILKEDDYFGQPRELSMVMDRLKEMGFYHQKTTISMNLLNMTKRRELIRFRSKKTKNWEYVIRK